MTTSEKVDARGAVSRGWVCIALIVASGLAPAVSAAEPPGNLARRAADRETENERARGNYTYRQTVVVEEVDARGTRAGEYKEVRDIIFTPDGTRTEQVIGRTSQTLHRLKLTEEDFRDIREVQPLLFTSDKLWLYETKYKGEENVDGTDCWILQVRPRQILQGQRLFDGIFWIDQHDFSIVKSEGQAVPQILSMKSENLFPRFTTLRERVDGKYRFPVLTLADDTLPFRTGPQRIRLTIRYANYKRFAAESSITFEK